MQHLWRIPLARPAALLVCLAASLTSAQNYELIRVDPDPAKGFHWPYFLSVPTQIKEPSVLVVECNNTGTSDDANHHESRARTDIAHRNLDWQLGTLRCPMLMPVFPRSSTDWTVYTHALDRDTLTIDRPGWERIDLQLIAMIEDARVRLAARGSSVDQKVFLYGYSASGTFANRFALLHPEIVRAASCGGVSSPAIPLSTYKQRTLNYPVGIADLQQLIGKPFDAAAFSRVPVAIFRGDLDTNDSVAFTDSYDDSGRNLIYDIFGRTTPLLRYRFIEGLYNKVTSLAWFYIMPNTSHSWGIMPRETVEFFERYRTGTPPPLPPKPLTHRLCFPHVAVVFGWGTDLGLVNNMEGVTVRGELRAFGETGGPPLETVPVTLPPMGRRVFPVNGVFSRPRQIAYAVFHSDSGFVSGYMRFHLPGSSVTIPASPGAAAGLFPKADGANGWTGLAFVNLSSGPAVLELSAMSDNGDVVSEATLPISGGVKVVGSAAALFGEEPAGATYFRYSTSGKVAGFCVNGAHNGSLLDGTPGGISVYAQQ